MQVLRSEKYAYYLDPLKSEKHQKTTQTILRTKNTKNEQPW
jgi:hypothetical protein